MRVLVTGGAGFIGSAVIRQYIAVTDAQVINVDKLTYAGSLTSLAEAKDHQRHRFEHVDICDRRELDRIFHQYRPSAVMHLAAETHVDRSIAGSDVFLSTNITGTHTLLESARAYWSQLPGVEKAAFRFHHVSTDEVYGDLAPDEPAFTEASPYAPSSPYSASKAASDHLARAWHRTYGLPVVISNCSNNYGPYQFPEKLIPLMIWNALHGRELPVYGTGQNIRDWLFVEDHARALRLVLAQGEVGRAYNIGGGAERTNLEVVRAICNCLDRELPLDRGSYQRQIRFVADRPGHDARYAIDHGRISHELGWSPEETFETGISRTVLWYLCNREWIEEISSGADTAWVMSHYSAGCGARP